MTAETWDREKLWHFRASPIRTIDGDTLVVLADTGFGGRHEVHVRIVGLNAPELSDPGGVEAKMRLHSALTWGSAWSLRIVTLQRETIVSEVRSFERFVADVFVVDLDGSIENIVTLL